ncbi:MAG: hypothetical protein RL651_1750 [Pseudomonadota bacterium]|jgi:serine/threonine-protein kinase HipA
MKLDVWIQDRIVGQLDHDAASNQFAFDYAPTWLSWDKSFALSPVLPLDQLRPQTDQQSRAVRIFFENLLPEGQALEDIAAAYAISKTNTISLIAILGQETAGALRIVPLTYARESLSEAKRLVTPQELSIRIQARPQQPFTIWDKKVRLSIAGYQDKIAVYQDSDEQWYLVEGERYASTHILKPEPKNPGMAGLTSNEFFCMRLARAIGLNVADVQLHHVPEPVLSITRFDRRHQPDGVTRLNVIDGCQALGLTTLAKYERPYGSSRDVKDIRTGASLPNMFALLRHSERPAVERLALLRWVIFQVLIGNTDAHAKNLTFYNKYSGLSLAPAYDLVAGLIYADVPVEDSFAMAIGDAFTINDLSTYEWANMAMMCDLPPALVQKEIERMTTAVETAITKTREEVVDKGADVMVVEQIVSLVTQEAERQRAFAKGVAFLAKGLK